MANYSPKTTHLKSTQWKSGVSGNPSGKPKGSKHLNTWIQEILNDETFKYQFANGKVYQGAPVQAIVIVMVQRALEGDVRAFDLLGKYGYGTKAEIVQANIPTPILGGVSIE